MGNMETAMVADYHNWKKGRSWFQKLLLSIFSFSGVYCAGYCDGWKAAQELRRCANTANNPQRDEICPLSPNNESVPSGRFLTKDDWPLKRESSLLDRYLPDETIRET